MSWALRPAPGADRLAHGSGEFLAQLDPPLVEGVHVPDHRLHEHLVLVPRDELADRPGPKPRDQDQAARAVARMHLVGHQTPDLLCRRPLGLQVGPHLVWRLPEGERFSLRDAVGQRQVLVLEESTRAIHGRDEIDCNLGGALVQQLEERVLRVVARLAPDHVAGPVVDRHAGARDALAVRLHLELLQVRREPVQTPVVRQHRERIEPEEVVVPDAEQAHQHGQVARERLRPEVLVHLVPTCEHEFELVHAQRERDRQPDRRPQRVAAADPVPHREARFRRDAESIHRRVIGRDRNEVMRDALLAQLADQPFARGVRVGERLLRRERLGADDEERGRRIDLLERIRELDAIDVRDAMQADAAVAKPRERLGRHDDAEIRPADADVDHVGETRAGEAQDAPLVHAGDEFAHLVELGAHLRHHVATVCVHRSIGAIAQRHVHGGAAFGVVDRVSRKQRRDARRQIASLSERCQQAFTSTSSTFFPILSGFKFSSSI